MQALQLYSPREVICATYHEPVKPAEEYYYGYEVLTAKNCRDRVLDVLGGVLARCWIDPRLMDRLVDDPHELLYEMGVILPDELKLHVRREKKNRPMLVIYENQKRVCALQMRMTATR